jgi:glycosyltransferase involved in cell wall biosynthesis
MPEILGASKAGYVCARNNPVEFAAAVLRILGDSALASTMQSNGRQFYENNFRAQKMARDYRELLN